MPLVPFGFCCFLATVLLITVREAMVFGVSGFETKKCAANVDSCG